MQISVVPLLALPKGAEGQGTRVARAPREHITVTTNKDKWNPRIYM